MSILDGNFEIAGGRREGGGGRREGGREVLHLVHIGWQSVNSVWRYVV